MTVNGHAAWSSEFNLVTREARPLNPISNTWCATGGFLSNGTFVNSGGNPMVGAGMSASSKECYSRVWTGKVCSPRVIVQVQMDCKDYVSLSHVKTGTVISLRILIEFVLHQLAGIRHR
jgi:hypothetical protein